MSTGICIKVSKHTESKKLFLVSCAIPEAMHVIYSSKHEQEKRI